MWVPRETDNINQIETKFKKYILWKTLNVFTDDQNNFFK